jgi:hypothetical protein
MSLSARLTGALVLVLVLLGTHWRAYTTGRTHQANHHAAAAAAAQQQKARQLLRQVDNTLDATYARTLAEKRIARDRLAARTELDRLRRDLATRRAAATAQDAAACDTTASDQLSAAMAADLAVLAEQGEAIATAADSHAADALMCWATKHANPTPTTTPTQED